MAELIAHRGLPRQRRENSLPSFALAMAAGATAIELDVHATRDDTVVVHHDPTLRPATGEPEGGRLDIASLTLDELRRADEASADPIPTLDDVLELATGYVTVYVEVKASRIERLVIEAIRRHAAQCAVHSFDHRVARHVRALAPDIPTGVLLTSYLIDPVRALRNAGARDLWQQWELIDQALVDRVHAARCRLVAWTVNDPAEARRLHAIGVDGICTDLSDELRHTVTRAPTA